jgi:hypothetical protein
MCSPRGIDGFATKPNSIRQKQIRITNWFVLLRALQSFFVFGLELDKRDTDKIKD